MYCASSTGLAAQARRDNFAQHAFNYWQNPANQNQPIEEFSNFLVSVINGIFSELFSSNDIFIDTQIVLDGDTRGGFVPQIWTMKICPNRIIGRQVETVGQLNTDEVGELVNTIYHEARHAEQEFRVLQSKVGQEINIANEPYPAKIITAASQSDITDDNEAEVWERYCNENKYRGYTNLLFGSSDSAMFKVIELENYLSSWLTNQSLPNSEASEDVLENVNSEIKQLERAISKVFKETKFIDEEILDKDMIDMSILTEISEFNNEIKSALKDLKEKLNQQNIVMNPNLSIVLLSLNQLREEIFNVYSKSELEKDGFEVGNAAQKAFLNLTAHRRDANGSERENSKQENNVISIKGDNNCFFHAVAEGFSRQFSITYDHHQLRQIAVNYMSQNRSIFENHLNDNERANLLQNNPQLQHLDPFDIYLMRMAQDGTWGGTYEAWALTLALGRNIEFSDPNNPTLDPNEIHLQFVNHNHFNLILPPSAQTASSSAASRVVEDVGEQAVQQDISNWKQKADDYIKEFFDNQTERTKGTKFGEFLDILEEMTKQIAAHPECFRGLRDRKGRLQAAAIVHDPRDYYDETESDYEIDLESCNLELEFLATAPWNILQNQPESVKGAGTALMETLIKESIDLGFEGRLEAYTIPGSLPFYQKIGFDKSVPDNLDDSKWELSSEAAKEFLKRQESSRQK
ncbi:hypothetical protein DSM107010_34970 [Chroococcidiopsis cubana SAG 39.79]|uniref:OTU domain-containing protein n=1 Tax=Chroococcidiopsis cubana SAG 39.79 TaxID=388085 RepID=A0AB37UIM3_9CYAN|nr:hypothetical protein DSM107010_34970 [Chroococcidiopsis cubana SAG 39.79]